MKAFFRNNSLFFLVLLLSLIKGFLWIHLIPVLQSPDAERHFSTMIWYAEPKERDWETKTDNKPVDAYNYKTYNIPEEYRNFLTSYQFEESRFNPNNHQEFSNDTGFGPNETILSDSTAFKHFDALPATIVNYPKPYYMVGAFVYGLFLDQPLIVRIFAIETYTFLISLATLYFAFKAAKLWGFERREAALFSGILAFQPMFSFMSVSINPDTLLFLGFSIFLSFALKIIQGDFRPITFLGLVVGSIVAIFSKPTGYATIPLLGLSVCIGLIRKHHTSKKYLSAIAVFSLLFFSILAGLFLRFAKNLGLEQIFSTSSKFGSYSNALFEYLKIHFSLSEQYRIFGSYWGWFGWLDYPLPTWIYAFILIIIVFSAAGLLGYLFQKDRSKQKSGYIFLIVSVFFFHLIILINEFTYFKDATILYGTQGRYFLPTIVPSLLLMALGLEHLTKKALSRERLLQGLFILMVFLNIYSLISVILPAYYL